MLVESLFLKPIFNRVMSGLFPLYLLPQSLPQWILTLDLGTRFLPLNSLNRLGKITLSGSARLMVLKLAWSTSCTTVL